MLNIFVPRSQNINNAPTSIMNDVVQMPKAIMYSKQRDLPQKSEGNGEKIQSYCYRMYKFFWTLALESDRLRRIHSKCHGAVAERKDSMPKLSGMY